MSFPSILHGRRVSSQPLVKLFLFAIALSVDPRKSTLSYLLCILPFYMIIFRVCLFLALGFRPCITIQVVLTIVECFNGLCLIQ